MSRHKHTLSSLTYDECFRLCLEMCGPLSLHDVFVFCKGTLNRHEDMNKPGKIMRHAYYRDYFELINGKVHLTQHHLDDRLDNPVKWRRIDSIREDIENGDEGKSIFDDEFLEKQWDEMDHPRRTRNPRK